MKRLSKKIISLMITLAIVMSMVISMHVSAAVMPGSGAQTLTITGQVYGENAEETNQVLEVSNITLSGKMGETFKGTVKAVVAGLDFFTLRAEADAQHLVLEIPQALENSISVEYGTFVSNISSQVLSLLGQMGIDLNDMTGTMPGLSSPFAQMSEEEIQDMIAPYLQLFMESIQECTSVENGVDIELTNLGLTKNGDLYTWAPTAEQFTELCEKLMSLLMTVSAIGYVIMLAAGFIPGSGNVKFILITLGYMLANFGQYGFYLIMMISIMNTVEYNEYEHGVRDEAIIGSLRPFLTKMASALTVAIANLTYITFGILKYTNGISEYEQAANAGEITAEAKADAITQLLSSVQNGQSLGLLVVMTVLPFLLMYASYVLYKKKYILDEAEYERICTEIKARQKEKTV